MGGGRCVRVSACPCVDVRVRARARAHAHRVCLRAGARAGENPEAAAGEARPRLTRTLPSEDSDYSDNDEIHHHCNNDYSDDESA